MYLWITASLDKLLETIHITANLCHKQFDTSLDYTLGNLIELSITIELE